ncbi:MAG: hypothetical protein ACNS64_07235, partial [Candidatus Halalkalibacterium sp. M3_1C_030]
MKFSLRTLFSILFLLPPLISFCQQNPNAEGPGLVDTLLKEIPFESRLEDAPRDIEMQFAQNPLGLPASKNERMIQLFSEGFVIDSLMSDVEHKFNERFNEQYADAIENWLNQESTRQVLEAEETSNTLQGARRRIVRMYEMEQNPPAEKREEIILSLIEGTSAVESAIESQTILFRSIVSAFSILSDQRTFSESQIDGIVNNYRLEIETQMESEVKQRFLIMYYDIENETLKEY